MEISNFRARNKSSKLECWKRRLKNEMAESHELQQYSFTTIAYGASVVIVTGLRYVCVVHQSRHEYVEVIFASAASDFVRASEF